MRVFTPFDELDDVRFTTEAPKAYARATSIHHWQLRDLISSANNENEFYCVYEQRLYCYDTKSQQSRTISSLDFSPNSMTCRLGYIAAGGTHGELEVRELSSGHVVYQGAVGSTVNNALHIAAHSNGDIRLFVCCNDNSIKVYRLPDMQEVTLLGCPCPINYTAVSPDASALVAVGDCRQTFLYQATQTGYQLLTSFTGAEDVGMCCDWNAHGTLFSSCHQDGSVAVWDQRSAACVAHFTLPTAARCMKFSAAPLDLLAVSEHEGSVSLLDSRQWSSRQVIDLEGVVTTAGPGGGVNNRRSSSRSTDVSGLAFTPSGERMWVGMEGCCVSFDIDAHKRRTFYSATML